MSQVQSRQRHCTCSHRGLTLVEVVAALTLLAGCATSILLAQSRSLRQFSQAEFKATASRLADEIMSQWRLNRADVCSQDEGTFEDEPAWYWQRNIVDAAAGSNSELMQVRLEIIHREQNQEPFVVLSCDWLEAQANRP